MQASSKPSVNLFCVFVCIALFHPVSVYNYAGMRLSVSASRVVDFPIIKYVVDYIYQIRVSAL